MHSFAFLRSRLWPLSPPPQTQKVSSFLYNNWYLKYIWVNVLLQMYLVNMLIVYRVRNSFSHRGYALCWVLISGGVAFRVVKAEGGFGGHQTLQQK